MKNILNYLIIASCKVGACRKDDILQQLNT